MISYAICIKISKYFKYFILYAHGTEYLFEESLVKAFTCLYIYNPTYPKRGNSYGNANRGETYARQRSTARVNIDSHP